MAIFSPQASTESRRVAKLDYGLIGSALVLLLVGLMSLYSVGMARDGGLYFRKQLINLAIGIVPFSVFYFVNPDIWKRISRFLYGLNLLLLVAVLVAGHEAKGAQRWIDIGPIQLQPSEVSKILVILTLASFYSYRSEKIREPGTFFLGLLHVIIPAILIFRQPHLGATLVILVSWFCVSLVAGIRGRYLLILLGVVVLGAVAVATIPALSSKFLLPYQQGRNPLLRERDVRGNDYQTWRAEIAFGVGGLSGSGFMRGEQKAAGYIPEQHNDFVFTIIGEEGGLIGGSLVLLAFGVFFYRVFLTMVHATEPFYRMIAAGIFGILGFHTIVNLFMVVQLGPVVGLWLPFLSHGGTALWLCVSCLGLLLNIRSREKPILF
ncbi:MAG: FtsW/RodA/SpoVE family cell cycle protein [Fimbriimonas sp.]